MRIGLFKVVATMLLFALQAAALVARPHRRDDRDDDYERSFERATTMPKRKAIKYSMAPKRKPARPMPTRKAPAVMPERLGSKAMMSIKRADIDVTFGGRLKEEFFLFDKPTTFRSGMYDHYAYWRHKLELNWHMQQGMRKHGKPLTEAYVKLSNYSWWQRHSNYMGTEKVGLKNKKLDGAQVADNHDHHLTLPLIYMEQAWFAAHFGAMCKQLKNHPITLKMGFFPYSIGRGLSLGMHEDMALTYAGWAGDNGRSRFPFMPPGILLTGKFSDNLSWDFYYNRWRGEGTHPSSILEEVRADRLSGTRPYRGVWKAWDTFALKLDFTKKGQEFGKFKVDPYVMYTRAPEQNVEFEADAKSDLGTIGFMADYTKNNWNVNVEVAAQFGNQTLFDIDRNRIELSRNKATGAVEEVFTHVYYGGANTLRKTPVKNSVAGDDLRDIVNLPANRSVARNGQQLVNAAGNAVQVNVNGGIQNVYNADFMVGGKRFRPKYKLDYQGVMALADVAYTFEDHPFKLGGAVAYIGGDAYPYNEEKNKPYKAFIAQRGFYMGRHVQPVFMCQRLVLARPVNITERKLYAEDHYRDYSNLQYIGLSGTWYPLEQKKKMSLMSNLVCYWTPSDQKKWNKQGTHPDPAVEPILDRLRQNFDFQGWLGKEKASSYLGTEWNLIFKYNLTANCQFCFRGFAFLPGELYKDLDGQPNRFVIRKDASGKTKFKSQGTSAATGFYTGFTYNF